MDPGPGRANKEPHTLFEETPMNKMAIALAASMLTAPFAGQAQNDAANSKAAAAQARAEHDAKGVVAPAAGKN